MAKKNIPAVSADEKSNIPKKKSGWLFYILAVPIAGISTIILTFSVFLAHAYFRDLADARYEAALLLEITQQYDYLSEDNGAGSYAPFAVGFDARMREINPDFICWIRIEGTPVDYPVVRGIDNIIYLDRSFFGEENLFGTLFMDYRNVGDFVPHIIIYGHMSRYGDKFGGLLYFLYDEFLERYNTVTLIVDGRAVEYEIFSARITDIHDPAYFLDFRAPGSFSAFLERIGAPPDAAQILTLSTCLSAGDDDGRILVQAALRID